MMSPTPGRLSGVLAASLALASTFAGCDRTTTTTQTPSGQVTTTTLSPSREASEAIGRANESLIKAATAIASSAAASQAMTRVGEAMEDGVITAKIKTALLADPAVEGLLIDVDTRNGVVTLSGTVATKADLDKALAIARTVEGVKSVENQLVAKS